MMLIILNQKFDICSIIIKSNRSLKLYIKFDIWYKMHKYSAILAALALLITSTVSTSFRTNNFRYGNYQPSQD